MPIARRPLLKSEVAGLGPSAPWMRRESITGLAMSVGSIGLGSRVRSQTVRGSFVRDVMASDLPPAQQQRVLAAGLLALDGRASELAAG